jgi:hypothetical protein
MPALGFPINCPRCGEPMRYDTDIVEGDEDAPRGRGAHIQARIYQCSKHGRWRVQADGKVLPHTSG